MDKDEIIGVVKYVVVVVVMTGFVWGLGKLAADSMSDMTIINPKPGVECVVVSRMFNTSVDCWKD